jgi:hypothetical protein
MMDLRYHVVSLIAVFLALAAGVVMGAALNSPERQKTAVATLQAQFEALRERDAEIKADNQALRQRLDVWSEAGRELRVAAVRNRLAGLRIGIAVCGADQLPAYWGELKATLTLAGAVVGPIIYLPDDLRPLDPATRARWALAGEPAGGVAPKYEAVTFMLRALLEGENPARLDELTHGTGIRIEAATPDPVRRVLVLVAPPDGVRLGRAAAMDLPEFALASAAGTGVRLVVCEEEAAQASLVGRFAARGLTTVDNVDTMLGQVAAVLALDGASGVFGTKPGASRPLPAIVP